MTSNNNNNNQLAMLTVETRWHFRGSSEEAVESVDFHPRFGDESDSGPVIGRLCTAGLDGVVRIWEIPQNTEDLIQRAFAEKVSHDPFVRHVASLERENADSVSCFAARWSPCGKLIASAYSDGMVKVWCYDVVGSARLAQEEDELLQVSGIEKWKDISTYRGPHHDVSEIVDVAFTRDSSHVCFVCNCGYVMIFSTRPGQSQLHVFAKPEAHTSALGLAMDPLGLMFGTTGSDTRLQFYDTTSLIKAANSAKLENWTLDKNASANRSVAEAGTVFDAVLGHAGGPFFRRSSWSPDGAMAAFPYGRVFSSQQSSNNLGNNNNNNEIANEGGENNNEDDANGINENNIMMNAETSAVLERKIEVATESIDDAIRPPSGADCVTSSVVFVFRGKLNRVAAAITVKDTTAIAGCRFAPKIFEPFEADVNDPDRARAKGAWGPLNYRYAIAVWTYRTVIIYTSDCSARHSCFSDLHYAKINDVAWTPRCRILAVASEDQTVSLISLNSSLGKTTKLRTIRESLPPHLVPPLVLVADTLLEKMNELAEANEAATEELVNKNAGGAVNKKVVISKKRRDRDGNAAAVAATTTTTDSNTQQQNNTNNNNADQQQQQQPQQEAAGEDELLAALG